jgi:hypothetical protein
LFMADELKSCPFCGGDDIDGNDEVVRCHKCGAEQPYLSLDHDATERWNTRASSRPPADQVPATSAQIQVAQDWIDNGFPVPNCAERVAIRAAIAALQAVPAASEVGWQSIESYPFDGTHVLVWSRLDGADDDEPQPLPAYCDHEDGIWWLTQGLEEVETPDWWRPLPEPPALNASICANCHDAYWVCENHPARPWEPHSDSEDACGCGAGMPCPVCNTGDPPRMEWSEVICSVDAIAMEADRDG